MQADTTRLRADLLAHYDRHKRDLPWRGDADPYRILVSEVMLQQTRVETVRDYYRTWLERFPDVQALASASESEVLKAWEGLGYYRRARNLHETARVVRERWDGRIPPSVEELQELPGVGPYTAGAVASIAFGARAPAVDGNVTRVLSRWYDVVQPTPRWLRETAEAWVHPDRPGDWNQALMELGATVCTPRGPRCDVCPVAWACRARAEGTVEERPGPSKRRAPRPVTFALCVLRARDGAVLLERRPPGKLLGGMWALPEREIENGADAGAAARARAVELLGPHGRGVGDPVALPEVRHRFTHIDATYLPCLLEVEGRPEEEGWGDSADFRWVSHGRRMDFAVPVAQRAVLEHV